MSIKLSPLIADGMVLQRNAAINVWGTAEPNNTVEVVFLNKKYGAKADKDGNWLCVLEEQPAGGPFSMEITSDKIEEKIIINDILIGDVWLCGGQSNMELMMNRVKSNYPDELCVEYPQIRQFKVPQVYNFHARAENPCGGEWESYSPQTALNFTAAGYFFAKKLYERYKVPIGLLASAVGGTPVCAWMSKEMLKDFPDELKEAEKCADDEYVNGTIRNYDKYSLEFFGELYKADEGFKQGWNKADYCDDTPEWERSPLCRPIDETGAFWFRRTFDIPEELQGKSAVMYLGTVVDNNTVYVNGKDIGSVTYRYPPSEYNFTLPSGQMTVAIRVLNLSGKGNGFTPDKNRFISVAGENRTIDLEGVWKRRKGAVCGKQEPQVFFNYKPTGLFNGMISPLLYTAVKGIIWYQGESDTGAHERYAEKMSLLINGWRELWGLGDIPFLFVQLAYYAYTGGTDWNLLREQQLKCLSLKNTGMAAALDLGEYNDLHPQNKRDIGERLARLAMRLAYGEILPPSPFEIMNR